MTLSLNGAPLLEVRGLQVGYGRAAVLDQIDFSVQVGETVALLGTNGAGKSTLLRAISGILAPKAGSICLAGQELTGRRPHEIVRLGVIQVPGGRATFPGLTVEENLHIGGRTVAKPERSSRVAQVLELFPVLAERRSQLAGTMSGGQQQQLALGRALMARPRLLMIDELSLGLAPVIVAQLLDVVRRLTDDGVGVVIVEQQVDLALAVSDRAYFLERGLVRFEGPAGELRGRTDLLRAVFLAETRR